MFVFLLSGKIKILMFPLNKTLQSFLFFFLKSEGLIKKIKKKKKERKNNLKKK